MTPSSSEGTLEKLSQVAVKGAEYDSPERHPHPKCLEGTRVNLLNNIHRLLDNREKNRLIWLHGMAGIGKSAVAFTVAERMRALSFIPDHATNERRLAGSFFFSRKHTKRCTTGYFFVTLAYQLAINFPSVREDVNRAIRENPALLGPNKSLREQMNALFLQPLWRLRFRLQESLVFVIDAIDECTSETELADLISLLGQALREPNLPVIHILLTSRLEAYIREAIQKLEVQLVDEIPGGTIISLDGTEVDQDIYTFLEHSFRQLQRRYPDFPPPTRDQLTQLVSRTGRRFIVASTMIKFIVCDGYKDPRDRFQLILELKCDFLPGTEVYELYDLILSTCANPKRAYQHLSIVAALKDPLPIPQLSKLLGPGQGSDVEEVLVQLRPIMEIPIDNHLPVNICHSSVRDYASDPSNCSLPEVQDIIPPHLLLAQSSLRLMMRGIPESTTLLDALSALSQQSQAMQPHDPQSLKQSLAFVVQPLEPVQVLQSLLWLRGDRSSDSQFWLETLDGRAWLQTQHGKDWLQTQSGSAWLQAPDGSGWLQTQDGLEWLQTQSGRHWLRNQGGRYWLLTQDGLDWLQTPDGQDWLQAQGGRDWLQTQGGGDWLQTQGGGDWLQTQGGRVWLLLQGGREWLKTHPGREWLQARPGQVWLHTPGGREWIKSEDGQIWLQSYGGKEWLQSQGGREWLHTPSGQEWLQSQLGRTWLRSDPGQMWLQTQARPTQLQNQARRTWLQDHMAEASRLFLIEEASRSNQLSEVRCQGAPNWLQCQGGREWLQSEDGHEWLQTQVGQDWRLTPEASVWATMEEFLSTFRAIREYTIIPELRTLPAFQAIQQFRSLPDFLMFPAFLASRTQDHSASASTSVSTSASTSALSQGRLPPDTEILRAMKAFMAFAQDARERSQPTSGALNYSCQNWAFHLSHAPSSWNDSLNHTFKHFWDHHLLAWLERQWYLEGLQSCLVVLSEGQRLAQAHIRAP